MGMRPLQKGLVLLLGLALAGSAMARDRELEARVERMERLLQSQTLVDMLTRLDQLQQEVQELRGELEVQTHKVEQLRQQQRKLYVDIDQRLRRLETGGGGPDVSIAPPEAPAAVPPGAGVAAAAGRPAASAPSADAAAERAAYEKALDILRDGRYQEAAAAYQKFLQDYPGSRYAANAQYWLAETFYVTRDFDRALQEFSRVIEQYPDAAKVPDAMLKLGYIHYELGKWAEARAMLEDVVKRYPNTTAARLAGDRLERMTKEGH